MNKLFNLIKMKLNKNMTRLIMTIELPVTIVSVNFILSKEIKIQILTMMILKNIKMLLSKKEKATNFKQLLFDQ